MYHIIIYFFKGDIPNREIKVIIEETNNPDSQIDRVVRIINNDPRVRIEVVQGTHMAVKNVTNGSIVIHLCPLTDNAVYRFLSKDGSLVHAMVEKLFISAGLHELLQKRKELEIKVKISEKEPTPEEKGNYFLSLLWFSVSCIFFITRSV